MAPIVDEVMAILPFEPAVHRKLGGPPCTYVGHPLLARLGSLRPAPGERPPLAPGTRPTLLVLPGSRRSEIRRLMAPFGAAVGIIAEDVRDLDIVLPAVPRLREEIEAALADWPVRPRLVSGEPEKLAAFRRAHAALAASGTATLELALSGVPMAVAYRVDPLVRLGKPWFLARSIVLPNLVLDQNVIPEFIDRDCTPERLAAALRPLLEDSPERNAQLAAFRRLDGLMATAGGTPAELAAAVVVRVLGERAGREIEGGAFGDRPAQRRLDSGT
jgi:lipid-A-disaccharide synthase